MKRDSKNNANNLKWKTVLVLGILTFFIVVIFISQYFETQRVVVLTPDERTNERIYEREQKELHDADTKAQIAANQKIVEENKRQLAEDVGILMDLIGRNPIWLLFGVLPIAFLIIVLLFSRGQFLI